MHVDHIVSFAYFKRWINEYICTCIKNMLIHLTRDISSLIKLSFNTPKSTRGLDSLSPILLVVVDVPLGCASGHSRHHTAWPRLGHPSHRSLSLGPSVRPAAFLVVVRYGTLLVIVGSTLSSMLFEPLMASAALPGHYSVSLPHPRPTPAYPLWCQPPLLLLFPLPT
jgi:hypothetical protein